MGNAKLFRAICYFIFSYITFFTIYISAEDIFDPTSRSQLQIKQSIVQNGPKVNVMDYGAKADGKNDDTNAIQKAIDQTQKGIIYFPKGIYRVSSTIVLKKSGLTIEGDNTTVLFAKGNDNPYKLRQIGDGKVYARIISHPLFLVTGELDALSCDVTEDIPRGSAVIKIASNEKYAIGDIVILASQRYGKEIMRQKEQLNYYRELNLMSEVVETSLYQIRLKDPVLIPFFRNNTLRINRVSPVRNVAIKGLNIEIDDSLAGEDISGITLAYAVNSIIENVTISKTSESGISLLHCYLCRISGNRVTDSTRLDSANGLGISLNRSHYCVVQNNNLNYHRHGIILDHGNSNCIIDGNTVTDCKTTASIDLHGEYNSYNVIRANIISKGKTGIVIGGGGEVHYNDGPYNCIVGNSISDCNVGIEIKNETESTIVGKNQFGAGVKKKVILTNMNSDSIISLN